MTIIKGKDGDQSDQEEVYPGEQPVSVLASLLRPAGSTHLDWRLPVTRPCYAVDWGSRCCIRQSQSGDGCAAIGRLWLPGPNLTHTGPQVTCQCRALHRLSVDTRWQIISVHLFGWHKRKIRDSDS